MVKFLIYISCLVAVIVLYPYFRIFLKRITLKRKLCRLCKKHGYRLTPTHPNWIFGTRRGENCDFYIETSDTVYAVKLFAVKRYHSELRLTEHRGYYIRSYIAFISGQMARMPIDSKLRSIPFYHFHYRMPESAYTKQSKPILLVHPICHEIRFLAPTEERVLSSGENVNRMFLYSSSALLDELRGLQ